MSFADLFNNLKISSPSFSLKPLRWYLSSFNFYFLNPAETASFALGRSPREMAAVLGMLQITRN